jgi:S-adenosylmethionine hydrolase
MAGRSIGAPLRTYGEAGAGQLLALWNSAGLLEVAVRDGSAAALLGAGRGGRITARKS